MVCEGSEFDGVRRMLLATLPEELCDTPYMELLILAIICMCISWNILLFLAFWWFMVDQYFVLRNNETPEEKMWYKYTKFYITRARNRKYQLLSPTLIIEMGEEQALQLMTYLTKVCPYAQLPSTIGLSYDGGFQYVNRFGAIGGQPFGNGNDGGGGNADGGGYHNVSSVIVGDGRRNR